MKIPKQIKIAGNFVGVELVTSKIHAESGCFQTWFQTIQINIEDRGEGEMAETFLHEMLEAIKYNFNLELDHRDLTVISRILFATIRDNNLDFLNEKGL